jgi:hypothetical protein
LLRGNYVGKETITVRVVEDDDKEKKLAFVATNVAGEELVAAGSDQSKS